MEAVQQEQAEEQQQVASARETETWLQSGMASGGLFAISLHARCGGSAVCDVRGRRRRVCVSTVVVVVACMPLPERLVRANTLHVRSCWERWPCGESGGHSLPSHKNRVLGWSRGESGDHSLVPGSWEMVARRERRPPHRLKRSSTGGERMVASALARMPVSGLRLPLNVDGYSKAGDPHGGLRTRARDRDRDTHTPPRFPLFQNE